MTQSNGTKKAVISNRIYLSNTPDLVKQLSENLHYRFPSGKPLAPPVSYFDVTRINDNVISMPVARTDLIPKGYSIVDKRVMVPYEFPEVDFSLREEQQDIYNQVKDSCILNAKPNWGKSRTALAIASKFGQKTLIVTHTANLRDQWEQEIKNLLKVTPGIIGGGKYNPYLDIVVGTAQTISKHTAELSSTFGTLIIDEVHHIAANYFKNIVDTSKARYKMGLSGTLERKDTKGILITDYISRQIYKPEDTNKLTPSVIVVKTNFQLSVPLTASWAKLIEPILSSTDYRELIMTLAMTQASLGHKVLVVSDRVEFLEFCSDNTPNSICITGSTQNRKELEDTIYDTTNILYGQISIYKEGINIPPLSCLILATPLNNDPMLEQLIGRIIREFPGKKNPVVVDVTLAGKTGKRQHLSRLGYYISKNYEVSYV